MFEDAAGPLRVVGKPQVARDGAIEHTSSIAESATLLFRVLGRFRLGRAVEAAVLNSFMNFSPSIAERVDRVARAFRAPGVFPALCFRLSLQPGVGDRVESGSRLLGRKHSGLVVTVVNWQIDGRVVNPRPRRIVCGESCVRQFFVDHAAGHRRLK